MKNLFLKILAIGLFLLVMPLSFYGQDKSSKISEINISNLSTIEERTFMIHSIQEHGYLCFRNHDKPNTIDVHVPNDSSLEFEDFDSFLEELYNECVAFSYLDKSERGELYVQWRQDLDNEVNFALYESFTKGVATENATCETALPFCTDNGAYTFPAGVNSGSPCGTTTQAYCSEPYYCPGHSHEGSYTSCLHTSPNPAFYYLRIATAGSLNIKIYSEPRKDIDFNCWGPFENIENACNQLSCNNIVDCSYEGGTDDEHCHINNAQPGKYYILLLTNYSNAACNIHFENIGSGATDCGIMPPLVNNDGPYCVGETITLNGNAQQGATYSWSGPGGWTASGRTVTRPNCTMAMSGEYTCTIHVGNQTNSASTQVQVYAEPTANFTAGTGCVGQPIQFTNTSTTNPSGQTITSYRWNFGDGQTSNLQNPSHTYTSAGAKTVTLTTGIGNGACSSTKTLTVNVAPQPVANAGSDQTIIYGATAPLSGSGGAGSFNYHWEPADKVVNPNAQNTQTKPLTAQQTFTLTVTSPQGGCTDSDQVTIHIEGSAMSMAPTANPTAICEGNSSQLEAHAGGGASTITYSWTPATGLNNTHIANPIASPTTTTTYTCTANDGFTTLTESVTVTVNHPESAQETIYICPGDTCNWHGQAYTAEDDYQFDTVTAQGCEKTITLHLRHYPSYSNAHTTTASICHEEAPYSFHEHPYYYTGTYYEHLQTIHGCDSTVCLNLTVYPDNGVTPDSVTVCPEQLPYYFYGVPYDHEVEVTHTDHDIHGCDSLVKLVLSINEYYMPDIDHQYIAYDGSPSYTWPVNGKTYTTEGQYIDTLPTAYCLGVFRLDLHFMQAPEPRIEYDTACDNHTWWVSDTHYDFEIPDGSISHSFVKQYFDDLAPYHFEDGRPCRQEYRLHLQMYKTIESILPVENECDSVTWQFGHNGESYTYFKDGTDTKTIKSKSSLMHCDSIVTLTIHNMIYTPEPEIVCADNGIEWPHHPITATEFNVNKYTYSVEDPHGTDSWINSQCQWNISKESWPISPSSDHLSCDVYAMDWTADTIWLTLKAVNPCKPDGIIAQFYLKPSFYSTQEQESYPASVNIAPNPNSGQMQLRFENMEGKLSIKVYGITGLLQDSFEVTTSQAGETYDYSMKRLVNGVYFFVITDGKRSVTKKVVIIN